MFIKDKMKNKIEKITLYVPQLDISKTSGRQRVEENTLRRQRPAFKSTKCTGLKQRIPFF